MINSFCGMDESQGLVDDDRRNNYMSFSLERRTPIPLPVIGAPALILALVAFTLATSQGNAGLPQDKAKPDKGKKYGKTLYRQRVHLSSGKSTQKFVVDELPDQAGVDPFDLLIDRIPDDNTMHPTLATAQASTR